jgi:tetratricopeptide (TPR) repeat protein
VIDNADDPNLDISRFFPNGTHGTIIITSRNPDLQKYGSACSCRIAEMTPEEAVALLLKTAAVENPQDESTRKAVGQVVKVLGYFALAIIQAAAVIRQRVCTIDEFCELYATQKKELLESGRSQSNVDYQYSVYTTWEISMKKIQEMSDKHAVLAIEILRLISFMHFDGIRKDIFKKAIENPYLPGDWYERGIFRRSILVQMMPSRWDGVMTGRALALLVAFSLITIADKGQISVHPLVHEWSRDRMSETQRRQAWETTVVTLGLANTNETDLEGQQRRKFLLPHIDACLAHDNDQLFVGDGQELAERSYAATTFMTTYNESNRADKSLELGLRDLKSKETQLQPDHYYCSMVKGHMAKNLFDLNRFQEAADIQQDLLTLALEQKSDDRIMTAMVGLAGNYNSLGEHQKAIDTCKDVMSKFRRVFGETERMILVAAEITAMANVAIGRPKEALGFAEKVLESHKQLLGEQHLDTLIAMHNLAKVYEALKQFKKARIYQEQCYGVSKESLGAEHGFTIQQLAKLAGTARREGRTLRTKWDIDYAKETVKVLGSKYGASDSRTLYYMEILGEDYFIYGALADAQLVQTDLVKKLIQTRGKEDKYTISAIESLSQTRKRMRVRHAVYWWMPQRRRDRKVVRL